VEYHRVQYWLSILFLLHINELPSVVDPHTRCRLFADDCLLYRVINNIEDQLQLQKDLAALEAWAADWVCSLIEQVPCYVYQPTSISTSSSLCVPVYVEWF